MDWQSKHFTQEAVFSTARDSVLAAARAVAAESFGQIDDSADGFAAQGRSGGHGMLATFRVEPAPNGTRVAVELRVARAAGRRFMLFDLGGYYDIQMRRWISGIAKRLGQPPLSRSQPPLQQGCLAGCLVYVVVGAGLALLALPLDRLVGSALPGPAMSVATFVGSLAGVAVFLYARFPDAEIWNALRERLKGGPNK